MGSMSWSDDTRCLYCEGRLPLYRKITHGQFCSSAHRKAYWQEQERLAVERLHETHNSLRSYRTPIQEELAPNPALEPPRTAATPLLEMGPAHVPEEFPLTAVCDLLGALSPEVLPRSGSSPELVAADPFEYEFATQPLPPAGVWSVPEPRPLPKGRTVPAWACVAPRPWSTQTAFAEHQAEEAFASALSQPQSAGPAVGIHAAARVTVPLNIATEASQAAAPVESTLQALDVAMAPMTDLALKVRPQSDVLVQLLDQQIDQQVPDTAGLRALAQFAAHQAEFDPARAENAADLEASAPASLPVAMLPVLTPDYRLPIAGTCQLPAGLSQAQGNTPNASAFAAEPVHPQASVTAAAMPSTEAAVYNVGTAGLQKLHSTLSRAAQGVFALQTADSAALDLTTATSNIALPSVAFRVISSTAPRVAMEESSNTVETAGLQSLPSTLLLPAQGVFALQSAESMTFDPTAGVASDITLPNFVPAGAAAAWAPRVKGLLPLTFGKKRLAGEDAPRPEPATRLFPQAIEAHPVLPHSGLEPLDRKPPEDFVRADGAGSGSRRGGDGLRKLEPVWAHATGFWQHAPRDLKLLLFAIPALLALVFHPGLPRVAFAAPQSSGSGFTRVINDQWVNVRQTLENRAAIALNEDFRSGLDNWSSPGGSTTEWSFDSTGFVKPGPLALYRPSVGLGDYQVQFMGLIDKKALSWVVRAADFENFYVVKLVVVKSGPIPAIGLTRYAVINGKAQDRHDVNIPLSAREDTLYNIGMNVQGSNFSVEVQGQIADSWTESRLPRGGIGFFTARGEESRVRWVQITHQYDMLGRLCAYLAPYDTTNGSWQP